MVEKKIPMPEPRGSASDQEPGVPRPPSPAAREADQRATKVADGRVDGVKRPRRRILTAIPRKRQRTGAPDRGDASRLPEEGRLPEGGRLPAKV